MSEGHRRRAANEAASAWDRCNASGSHQCDGGASDRNSNLADIISRLGLPATPLRAIDVGCGTGEDVRWLAGAGFQVVGIDVSSMALQLAAERTSADPLISWVQASATALPIADESCVLVTDRGCLHHVAEDDVHTYAAEVERVLVSGGAWVIRDMIGHSHQHRELDRNAIEQLAAGTSLSVEVFEIACADHQPGSCETLLTVLRRL